MSKYIKVFDTVEDYNAYSGSTGFVSPNVSYIVSGDTTKYDDNEIKHYEKIIEVEVESWIAPIAESAYTATTFNLSTAMKKVDIPSGVTTIANSSFDGCSALTSITIPDTVTNIGDYTFERCSSLTSVNIPRGVITIGNCVFSQCSSLTSVTIPDTVTSIGTQAFMDCGSLASIDFPSGITSIGQQAFLNCSGLAGQSIIIPSGVTSIGNQAFRLGKTSNHLESVTVLANNPPTLGSSVFTLSFGNGNYPIYVPSESVEIYKAASGWSDYASRIQAIPTD